MQDGSFATLIGCIDGRTQIPLHTWIRKTYQVRYVDTITEPGVDGLVEDQETVKRIRTSAMISKDAHGSKLIVVSGHHMCAANPGSAQDHAPQIKQWVDMIRSWKWNVEVVGVWVNEDWEVEPINMHIQKNESRYEQMSYRV